VKSWEPLQTAAPCWKRRNDSNPTWLWSTSTCPHVHGLEVCRQIKQDNPDARVVMFSAMNDSDVEQRSFEVGASAFVSKGTGDLLSTIKRLCDDGD